jgi:excisionase family DNA binding protein
MRARVDELLQAANQLAATIAVTEEITQRRAEILTEQRVIKGPAGGDRSKGVVSLSEAAQRTGRHPEVLRRWCMEGRIPATRVGRTWVIERETLAELLAHSSRSRPRLSVPRSA